MTDYALGSLVTISGVVTVTGVLTDPSFIEIHIKNPSGVITTASALKSAVGVYYNNITANAYGTWIFQFSASGTVQAVGNGTFNVLRGVI